MVVTAIYPGLILADGWCHHHFPSPAPLMACVCVRVRARVCVISHSRKALKVCVTVILSSSSLLFFRLKSLLTSAAEPL